MAKKIAALLAMTVLVFAASAAMAKGHCQIGGYGAFVGYVQGYR